jgi:DNA modification methylase
MGTENGEKQTLAKLPLHVEHIPTTALVPYASNARKHSERQLEMLKTSVSHFGFSVPVLIDDRNTILAGHACVEVAKRIGLEQLPCIRLAHLSDAQKKAFVITHNRLAEHATWDTQILAAEFRFLAEADLDFSVEITGFQAAEIDFILEQSERPETDDPADQIPALDPTKPVITEPGDRWRLGKHRILCADARDPASFALLLGEERGQMVFTDPPYNVPINGHVSGRGRVRHREFAMASGEMSSAAYTSFLKQIFDNLAAFTLDGSIHDVCIDWRHMKEMLAAGENVYSELLNLCVWNKDNGGMGSLYRSKHELIFIWKVGNGQHINNVQLGRFGRSRNNVWDYRGANRFGRDREHPTIKPVALVADAIRDCSKRGGVILDPFVGSGTTIIAAERTGRRAAAIEIDRGYVDTAIRRWQELTGETALHEKSGFRFTELEQRKQEASSAEHLPNELAGRLEDVQ